MTTLNRQQSRNVDHLATEQFGISGLTLMENAGRACTDVLETHNFDSVILLCGKGNNGGDGFVIARHLLTREIPAITILLVDPVTLTGDAKINFEILTKLPSIIQFGNADNLTKTLNTLNVSEETAIADCLIGTGGRGIPRTPFAEAIEWANKQPAYKVAIDIPSGLDCDTGEAASPTFHAQQTLTMVAAKTGFFKKNARNYTGDVIVLDIGIPLSAIHAIS
tara:strand:+ start:905 stop:1570 length:666 start_codon:yes stop_codon:yes gene_type:complete